MTVTATTAPTERERWLAWRRGGIGGSDIAGVLGLSKWSSPWSVWADKLGLLPANDESELMKAGRWLELAIGPWFAHETGLAVAGEQTWLTHPEHEWMRCTVDGFVHEAGQDVADPDWLGGLEIKTAWPGPCWEEIPPDYQAQAQWQMAVSGLDRVWFAVLMGRRLDIHELERDQGDIDYMVDRAEKFWRSHVLPGDPPETDDHDATAQAIAAVYPTHTEGESAPLDDLAGVIREWNEAKRLRKAAESLEKGAANTLRAALGAAEEGTVAGRRVLTLRTQTRTTTCKACRHAETSDPFRVLRPATQKGMT